MHPKDSQTYKIIFLIFLFFIKFNVTYSQNEVLEVGEELNYVVYYGFIELGEVNMKITGKETDNDKTIYTATSVMKSYKGIPFVSLNNSFTSEMVWDGKDLYSKRFSAKDYREDGAVISIEYKFNYDSNFVYVHKDNNGKTERDENIKFNSGIKFQDGLSLFYQARISSFSPDDFLIPVFMNEAETSVNYYFSSTLEEISISLSDDDVKCVRCSGVANFVGVFGLKGEFVGWFSNDNKRVPLKSQLNVVIGNITLELDSYKRNGWKPN